jgi:iron complex outermembrane receptor protein
MTKTQLKIYLIPLFICLLSSFSSYAQKGTVRGTVYDETDKEYLFGAVVVIKKLQIGTNTNENGEYELKLSPGTYLIEANYVGCDPFSKSITITEGQEIKLNIKLKHSAHQLETIVISAGKHEQKLEEVVVSMEVLKPSYIENSNQTSMETAAEQIPGVTVIDGQANIRGGSGFSYGAGSRVLILVDDLPLLAGDAGDAKWSFLPIENLEQVEVIKGASSALFGSSALNGVINLRTAYPTDSAVTNLSLYTGFYDSPADKSMKWWGDKTQMTSGINFSHREKIKNLDLTIGGHHLSEDGYRVGDNEERWRGNVSLRYHFKKISGLNAGLAINTQRAGGYNYLIWQNDTTGALLPLGGLDTTGSTASKYNTARTYIDPSINYTRKNISYKLRSRYFITNNKNNTNQGSKAQTYFVEFLTQYNYKNLLTLSGGISSFSTDVKGDLFSSQTGKNISLYFQGDLKYGKWNVSSGIRFENGKISGKSFDTEKLVRFGVNFHALKYTYLRASYGQGFRFPTIAEKFIKTRVGDIVIYPNDSLNIERGSSIEIGVRQLFKVSNISGIIDLSVFRQEYKDMMEFTFGPWGNPFVDPLYGLGFKSTNIGNTRIDGIELTLTGQGEIGKVKEEFMGGITMIDPYQTDFLLSRDSSTNSSKANILKYRYKTMIKFDSETTYKKFAFGISARYYSYMENIDKVFEGVIPGVKHYRANNTSGEWVFDTRLSYAINKNFKIALIGKNISNNTYVTRPADMQAPRSYSAQASFRF